MSHPLPGTSEVLRLAVPFTDSFAVADTPRLRPLVRAIGEAPRAAVLFVDGESGDLTALTAQGAAEDIAPAGVPLAARSGNAVRECPGGGGRDHAREGHHAQGRRDGHVGHETARGEPSHGRGISSVMTLVGPAGHREAVIRVATINPGPAIRALEARGYKPRDSWRGGR